MQYAKAQDLQREQEPNQQQENQAGLQNNENDISGRIDRLPLCFAQWRLWLFHEIGFVFGHVGLATATFTLASIGAEYAMSTATKGLVASVLFAGMLVGASVSGYLGDRFGRKPVLVVAILIWSAGAFLLAWSPNEAIFFASRLIVGLGIGAHLPMTLTMISEVFPASARGKAICLLEGGYPLGCIFAGIISWVLLAFFDWRMVFFAQALGGLSVLIIIFKVPESARWLEAVGKKDEAKLIVADLEHRVTARTKKKLPPIPEPIAASVDTSRKPKLLQLFAKEQFRKTTTLWFLWFCVLLGNYGLNTWISALLVDSGFDVVRSSAFVLLMYLPGIPGFLAATFLVERLGRKKLIFAYLLLAALFCFLYGSSTSLAQVILFGCCMQFFMFGVFSLIYTYAAEVFPTHIRSLGTGTTSSAGRVGALLAPTLFGVLLPVIGNAGIFDIGAAAFIAGATIIIIFGVETKGRRLEEI